MLLKKLVIFIFTLVFFSSMALATINCPNNMNSEDSAIQLFLSALNVYTKNSTASAALLPQLQDLASFILAVTDWNNAECSQKGAISGSEIFVISKNLDIAVRRDSGRLRQDNSGPVISWVVNTSTGATITAFDNEGVEYVIFGEKMPGQIDYTSEYYDCAGESTCNREKSFERTQEGTYEYYVKAVSIGGIAEKREEYTIGASAPSQGSQNQTQTCSQRAGVKCSTGQSCNGTSVLASDGICCTGSCRNLNSTSNSSCSQNSDCGVSGTKYTCEENIIKTYNVTFTCSLGGCSNVTTNKTAIAICSGNLICINGQQNCQGSGCTNGSTQSCTGTGNCAGTQTCTGGSWSNCACNQNSNSCTSDSNCSGSTTYTAFCSGSNLITNKTAPTCSSGSCGMTTTQFSSQTCPNGCLNGQCNACTPNCAGKSCGDNGCGGVCGTCGSGYTCTGGQCVSSGGLVFSQTFTPPLSGSYNDFADRPEYNPTLISFAAWVKPSGTGAEKIVLSKAVAGQYKLGWMPSGQFRCTISTNSRLLNYDSYGGHTAENWYYVVCTYDGTSAKVYVNGVLENSVGLTGDVKGSSSSITIGDYSDHNPVHIFTGKIYKVDIYNYALSQTEVTSFFNSTYSTVTTSGWAVNIPEGFNIWDWLRKISGYIVKVFKD